MQMLYLCNIQTISTANIKQFFVLQNIFNQKVTNMEEKKINEAQAAEQTTSQENENVQVNEVDALKQRIEELEKELKDTKSSKDYYWDQYSKYMGKVDILKSAIKKLGEKFNFTDADIIEAMVHGNDMDVDDLLNKLSGSY